MKAIIIILTGTAFVSWRWGSTNLADPLCFPASLNTGTKKMYDHLGQTALLYHTVTLHASHVNYSSFFPLCYFRVSAFPRLVFDFSHLFFRIRNTSNKRKGKERIRNEGREKGNPEQKNSEKERQKESKKNQNYLNRGLKFKNVVAGFAKTSIQPFL